MIKDDKMTRETLLNRHVKMYIINDGTYLQNQKGSLFS